jgi:esterase/lipase superfamily enzyme
VDLRRHEVLIHAPAIGGDGRVLAYGHWGRPLLVFPYHAANFTLRRADLFPLGICQSGVYDVSVVGGGARGNAVY